MMLLSPAAGLQEVHSQLAEAGPFGDGASFQQVDAMVRRLAELGRLASLIQQVLSDECHLAEIAARSYYHANNFLKIVLMVGPQNAWKLRLHIWHPLPDGLSAAMEDIHSHRWDFTTALVLGEYCAREFRTGPGDEYYHYKYRSVGENQRFSMEAHGRDQLCNVFEARLPAGTVYHLNHQVLHSISRSGTGATASLLVQGAALRGSTDVYRTSLFRGQVNGGTRVQRPAVDQLRAELMRFLTWL